MTRVDDLLAAPRGRSLCEALPGSSGDAFTALDHAVAFAVYWQEPIDGYSDDEILRPCAEQVLLSPDIGWWRSPVQLDDQWFTGSPDGGPAFEPVPALARWRQEQRAAAYAPEYRYRDDVSGTWWSSPIAGGGLADTTRSLPGRGPAALWLTEDAPSVPALRCWPVALVREPRVFEVHGPDDWALLARTYPFDVTDSRSPDWRRATGRVGRWVIPDWPAVAEEYDAVHVSVWGWLTTAGRPVAVDGAASLLAGWSPDATFWLTDCLELVGDPVDYVRRDQSWQPA